MLKIQKSELKALFGKMTESRDLFLPVKVNGKTNFALYNDYAEVDLETLKTIKSAKDAFFPQSETLYSVKTEDGKLSVIPAEMRKEQFVVFGVKGCDVKGFDVLDKVFLAEPVDNFYKSRRENGIVVSLACNEPDTSCFCKAFGIDNADPCGDITITECEDYIYWTAKTEKGEALTNELADLFENCDSADDEKVNAQKANIAAISAKLPNMSVSLEKWGKDENLQIFNSENWSKLYTPCLACGTCTFVCPTCQCYDIKDYKTGKGVERYRCWDSCMYSDFTMMAHGNNRTSQMQRFRQRFMHKLVYFPTNNDGMFSCVGCGRCVDSCPSGLNILKVIKKWEDD